MRHELIASDSCKGAGDACVCVLTACLRDSRAGSRCPPRDKPGGRISWSCLHCHTARIIAVLILRKRMAADDSSAPWAAPFPAPATLPAPALVLSQ